MKEIKREKIKPIWVVPGETLELTYTETATFSNGKVVTEEIIVLETKIDRSMVVDEAVAFYVEKGDFKGAKDGIGGAFLASRSFKRA